MRFFLEFLRARFQRVESMLPELSSSSARIGPCCNRACVFLGNYAWIGCWDFPMCMSRAVVWAYAWCCLATLFFGCGQIKKGLQADLSWNERKACRPRVIPGLSGSSWYLDDLEFLDPEWLPELGIRR